MPGFYEYTKVNYTCQFCGWQGTGEEAEQDEMFDCGFQIVCPKCYSINPDKSKDRVSKPQYLDYIPYPEFGEVLKKGTDEYYLN